MTHHEQLVQFLQKLHDELSERKKRIASGSISYRQGRLTFLMRQPYVKTRREITYEIELVARFGLERELTAAERAELKQLLDHPDWQKSRSDLMAKENEQQVREAQRYSQDSACESYQAKLWSDVEEVDDDE